MNGTWAGRGVWASGGGFTLLDSHVTNSQASAYPALFFDGYGSAQALLVQRSVLQDSANAHPGALQSESGNVTVDSSEILGGKAGIYVASPTKQALTLTLSASTVDAGEPGVEKDTAGTTGIEAVAKGAGPSSMAAQIQGSIVLERQNASATPGDTASVGCAYSAVPSEVQAATGGTGAVSCAAGTSGNTESNPLSSLLAEPLSATS